MKSIGAHQKLRFTVHSCSGEDSDHPSRELLYHRPETRGWQSERFCNFPQEITIQLQSPSKIHKIQILAHESKIPTKVEVFIGMPPGDGVSVEACKYKRLGYLSFDTNERSNYEARELKSVQIDSIAYVVRLVIHKCHLNKVNIYNQVGIVALNLIGEPLQAAPSGPPPYLVAAAAPNQPIGYYNQAAAEIADLNIDLHVDATTAAQIRTLAQLKEKAVEREDYDEAKELKQNIEKLKVLGHKIAQLEARKRAAVESEDYDLAKTLKIDIEKLRQVGDLAATAPAEARPPLDIPSSQPETYHQVPAQTNTLQAQEARRASHGGEMDKMPTSPRAQEVAPLVPLEVTLGRAVSVPSLQPSPSGMTGLVPDAHARPYQQYEDRPARGRGDYMSAWSQGDDSQGGGGGMRLPTRAAMLEAPADDLQAPEGWPGDLPPPEPLGGANKEGAAFEELVGEYVARALVSKNWQLRDAAVQHVTARTRQGQLQDRRGVMKILQRGLKDKVPNVFHSALPLFQCLLETNGSNGAREVRALVDACLPLLIEKLGDNNTRLREGAVEFIVYLAGVKDVNLGACSSVFLKPVKNQTAWRPVLTTLQLLQELVPLIGVAQEEDKFDLEAVMDYVGRAFGSPNADVRSSAVRLAGVVAQMVGPVLRKYLPKDVHSKIKEQLEDVLGKSEAAIAEGTNQDRGDRASGRTTKQQPSTGARNTDSNRKTGKDKAVPSTAVRVVPPAPPAPDPLEEGVFVEEDPEPFQEELRLREQQYGPEHPAVAESCSNLAIVYNQRGDYWQARPLYERALRIYERVHGPNHQEVAHTLTDLAVLHLEQGKDDLGRPLLQRALNIQEAALGADHPDVIAIKDVLNSE